MNLTFFEKIEELVNLIVKSPLFLTSFIIYLSILTFLLIDIKSNNKIREKFVTFLWLLSIGFIAFSYYDYFIKLSDNLVEEVLTAIYFPNLAVYTILIVTINIFFITTILKKSTNFYYKTCNLVTTLILDFLLILILETIVKNKIDVYEPLNIYSNDTLLILLQLSSIVYTAWLFMLGILKLVFNKIGEPVKEEVKVEVKESIVVEETPIYKPNFVYDAPASNHYEKEDRVLEPLVDNNDYTNVFSIEPVIEEKKYFINDLESHLYKPIKQVPKYFIDNLDNHLYIEADHIEEKKYFINDLASHLYKPIKEMPKYFIDNLDNHLYIEADHNKEKYNESKEKVFYLNNIEDHLYREDRIKQEKVFYINDLSNHLYVENTKVEEIPDRDYRIPLFDTIDNPIMSMLSLNREEETTVKTKVIKNVTLNIEEELYERFKNGEELNVDQYRILKSYLTNK